MHVALTPEQVQFIQSQMTAGRYNTPEAVIAHALDRLAEWEKSYDQWLEETRQKVNLGLQQIEQKDVIEGEGVIAELHKKIWEARENR